MSERHVLHVLMIEDNPGDARLLRDALADSPHLRIAHRDSLSSGIDELGQGPFDAVLLDLSLPDSHGLETVRRVHASSPSVPIVVMTSLDDHETALDAMSAGAQDYLVKGLDADPRTLGRALRYAIERQHWQDQLAESRELAAMGRLAGATAHEFNTLLTTVLGCSDMLIRKLEPDSPLRELALVTREAAQRAAAVTEQVLAAGGRKRLLPVRLSLNDALRAAGDALRHRFGGRASLTIRPGAECDAVMFDAAEVARMLDVLALTAAHLVPDGAAVIVGTRNELFDAASARRHALKPGLYVVLNVHVPGCELSRESIATMVEPSAAPAGGDACVNGLSLAGVHATLRACGGRLAITSSAAGGTTFSMFFAPDGCAQQDSRP